MKKIVNKMGGEKWPVLVYGSTERNNLKEWILKFSLIDIHEFAKQYKIKNKNYDLNDESIFLSYYETDQNDFERLIDFVLKNDLIIVYFDTYNWNVFGIGMEVHDFDEFDQEKEKVFKFCEKYGMSKPKIYAGIVGEFE